MLLRCRFIEIQIRQRKHCCVTGSSHLKFLSFLIQQALFEKITNSIDPDNAVHAVKNDLGGKGNKIHTSQFTQNNNTFLLNKT